MFGEKQGYMRRSQKIRAGAAICFTERVKIVWGSRRGEKDNPRMTLVTVALQ